MIKTDSESKRGRQNKDSQFTHFSIKTKHPLLVSNAVILGDRSNEFNNVFHNVLTLANPEHFFMLAEKGEKGLFVLEKM